MGRYLSFDRLAEIAKRAHEDPSEDAANFNELLEVLEMLGFDPETGRRVESDAETDRMIREGMRHLFDNPQGRG